MTNGFPLSTAESRREKIGRVLLLVVLLYLFLVAISLLGASFKLFGKGFSAALLETTSNPVVGVMTGLLATAFIQSSSTTTSIVVGLVASGSLTVTNAVPVIMGANLGTTVTNTIVALAAVRRPEEFRRSFGAATVHDIFNLMALMILFPIEMATHVLQRTATSLSTMIVGTSGFEFANPVKTITKPVAMAVIDAVKATGLATPIVGTITAVIALGLVFFVLSRLPRLLREMFLGRAESAVSHRMRKGGSQAILIGIFLTVLVQSSSITTSLMVPLVGAGILTIEAAFPITLGANIGTTVTALLAATTGTQDAVTIALVHLLFNIGGILLIWPIPAVRNIPVRIAKWFADRAVESKLVPIAYLLGLFFAIPGLLIFFDRITNG